MKHVAVLTIYKILFNCIYIYIRCAFVGLDDKLYSMHGTYIKMINDVWRNSHYYDNHTNFHTTRPVGRPRTRWADVVQRDALRLLGIRGWRKRVENRDEWRRLMGEAKAWKGL
jgi:hypothetical protein